MTMPPLGPTMPALDPSNVHQMAEYYGRWLYALDPKEVEDAWEILGAHAVEWTKTFLEEGLLGLGMKRGDPQQRWDAYVRKSRWATERDPATGELLHPVMAAQDVVDPATGLPTGESQPVPTAEGEDLWALQAEQFPRQFLIDARDAYDMGAPMPEWVASMVLETKAREEQPDGPKALRNAMNGPRPKKGLVNSYG